MKINKNGYFWMGLILFSIACGSASLATLEPASTKPVIPQTETSIPPTQRPSATAFVPPTSNLPPTQTFTLAPPTETATPTVTVEILKAKVIADLLSCRYGPGSEYIFLYGLNKDARIRIVGRTDANNWVMVDGKNKCWVNEKFLEIDGDPKSLPIKYPGEYKLPVSPYYTATYVFSATRDKNNPVMVKVSWDDIPLRAGDEEDEYMNHYIIEVWRCEGGQFIFDPLATNDLDISFVDEAGCNQPSHGRVFVQDKHGFAGPAEIPTWPPLP